MDIPNLILEQGCIVKEHGYAPTCDPSETNEQSEALECSEIGETDHTKFLLDAGGWWIGYYCKTSMYKI